MHVERIDGEMTQDEGTNSHLSDYESADGVPRAFFDSRFKAWRVEWQALSGRLGAHAFSAEESSVSRSLAAWFVEEPAAHHRVPSDVAVPTKTLELAGALNGVDLSRCVRKLSLTASSVSEGAATGGGRRGARGAAPRPRPAPAPAPANSEVLLRGLPAALAFRAPGSGFRRAAASLAGAAECVAEAGARLRLHAPSAAVFLPWQVEVGSRQLEVARIEATTDFFSLARPSHRACGWRAFLSAPSRRARGGLLFFPRRGSAAMVKATSLLCLVGVLLRHRRARGAHCIECDGGQVVAETAAWFALRCLRVDREGGDEGEDPQSGCTMEVHQRASHKLGGAAPSPAEGAGDAPTVERSLGELLCCSVCGMQFAHPACAPGRREHSENESVEFVCASCADRVQRTAAAAADTPCGQTAVRAAEDIVRVVESGAVPRSHFLRATVNRQVDESTHALAQFLLRRRAWSASREADAPAEAPTDKDAGEVLLSEGDARPAEDTAVHRPRPGCAWLEATSAERWGAKITGASHDDVRLTLPGAVGEGTEEAQLRQLACRQRQRVRALQRGVLLGVWSPAVSSSSFLPASCAWSSGAASLRGREATRRVVGAEGPAMEARRRNCAEENRDAADGRTLKPAPTGGTRAPDAEGAPEAKRGLREKTPDEWFSHKAKVRATALQQLAEILQSSSPWHRVLRRLRTLLGSLQPEVSVGLHLASSEAHTYLPCSAFESTSLISNPSRDSFFFFPTEPPLRASLFSPLSSNSPFGAAPAACRASILLSSSAPPVESESSCAESSSQSGDATDADGSLKREGCPEDDGERQSKDRDGEARVEADVSPSPSHSPQLVFFVSSSPICLSSSFSPRSEAAAADDTL
ncbi:hypothetical protein BESB_046790 [Besnoitia besnoiti]|uniref:Uncharacterized protein n=1 Tax=Besnoitia besnoiti TaxID=94643 RepID=A0A2A9MLG9_BESBE|nr:hypothetical protein BESB_046790 [Besnoitia besnoiti]PFH36487.1 hypothetical protein BESB_046790 [Besnoitia besnoiti]